MGVLSFDQEFRDRALPNFDTTLGQFSTTTTSIISEIFYKQMAPDIRLHNLDYLSQYIVDSTGINMILYDSLVEMHQKYGCQRYAFQSQEWILEDSVSKREEYTYMFILEN